MSIQLDDIGSGFNKAKIDANFKKVEQYLNSVVLSRANTGVPGEATMERDLDLNSKRILNAFVGETPLSDLGEKVKIIEDFIENGVALYEGMRSFELGNTLTRWNQALFWEESGTYFRWEGAFPKVVPARGTPDTTGGIGNGKWIDIGNISTLEDSHHTKLLQIYFAELVTGRMGGTADGAKIDYTYDPDTGAMVETIPYQLEKAINSLEDVYSAAIPYNNGNPVEAGLTQLIVPYKPKAVPIMTVNGLSKYNHVSYDYEPQTGIITLKGGATTEDGEIIVFHAVFNAPEDILEDITPNTRELWRRSLAEIGLTLVSGSFREGATVNDPTDSVWDIDGAQCYTWTGDFPHTADGEPGAGWVSVRVSSGSENVYLVDFLPTNYDRTGTVDYKTQIQQALYYAATNGKKLINPAHPIAVDVTSGDILVPSNTSWWFPAGCVLIQMPTARTTYNMIYILDVSNVEIYNLNIIGDKYTHLAIAGEHGHGVNIRGRCNNIRLYNPNVSSCWGDGFYIGQKGADREDTPSNIFIYNPVADKCRRQGMSITSVNGLVMDNPVFTNTKSSDSRFTLVNGPHAGIDIEPNYYQSQLNNIVINNMTGGGNDGPLLSLALLSTIRDYPYDLAPYPLNITVNGLHDNRSYKAVEMVGANNKLLYSGEVVINNVTSIEPIANGVGIRTWHNNSVPVTINGVLIKNWWSTGRDLEPYLKMAICIDRGNGNTNLGGITITGVKLKNTLDVTSPALISVFNNDGEVNDTRIIVDSVEVKNVIGYFDVRQGNSIIKNVEPFTGLTQVITSNASIDINIIRDYHISKPGGLVTIQLPDMTPQYGSRGDYSYNIKFTKGVGTKFRVRSPVTPLVCNSTTGTLFEGDEITGVCNLTYSNGVFFLSSVGVMTKVS